MIAAPTTRDTRGALSLLSCRPDPACADTRGPGLAVPLTSQGRVTSRPARRLHLPDEGNLRLRGPGSRWGHRPPHAGCQTKGSKVGRTCLSIPEAPPGPSPPRALTAPLSLPLGGHCSLQRGAGGAPYRHCLGPGDGLCAGLGARLLGVGLCWCVQGHAVLRGDRGLARVVLRGVRRGWRVLGGDAVLWRRGVLGRGVGLGHRFRRSRGVLIALRREREQLVRRLAGPDPAPF